MLTDREVLSTINMLRSEHLDVRTVTMGINLFDCASSDFDTFAYKVRSKIFRYAENSLRPVISSATATASPSSTSAFP